MAIVEQRRRTPFSLRLVCGIDATAAIGAPAANFFIESSDVALSCGAALIGVATFLGFAYYGLAVLNRASSDALRDAIAAAFVTVYLTIVAWSAFFAISTSGEPAQLSPLTQTVISNFTYLTGIVVAFYFGTDALMRIGDKRTKGKTTEDQIVDASNAVEEVTSADQNSNSTET
jgi:hypothetical protein